MMYLDTTKKGPHFVKVLFITAFVFAVTMLIGLIIVCVSIA